MTWLSGWNYHKSVPVHENITPTGTITVTNNSQTVIGLGTNFASWHLGDKIKLPDENWYTISAIASNVELTISVNYPGAGASGQSYVMKRINYQKFLRVHRESGTDSGDDVYVDTKCRTDFGDVRFTRDDGSTELDYWLESYTSTVVIFWYELHELASNADTIIYIYYGKSDATTTSNGDNTFLFYDHFLGTTLNTEKWYEWTGESWEGGSYSISNSIIQTTGDSGKWEIIGAKIQFNFNVAFRFRAKFGAEAGSVGIYFDDRSATGNAQGAGPDFGEIGNDGATYGDGKIYINTRENVGSTSHRTSDLTSYIILEMRWLSGSTEFLENDASKATITTNVPQDNCGAQFASANANSIYIDWVAVRKYVNPEPTHGAWGSEETPPVLKKTRLFFVIGDLAIQLTGD